MLTSNMPRLEPRFHQVDLIGLASNCDLESLLACAKMRCEKMGSTWGQICWVISF